MFTLFSFKDEFKADTSSSKTNNSEILNFESLKYSISDNTHEILLHNSCNPDKNFFDTDIQNIDTPYILPEEFESFSCKLNSKSFSILHLNIRSLAVLTFDSFNLFLSSLNFEFNVICFSETWLDDSAVACESLYKLAHYNTLHQLTGHSKGGSVSIYISDSFNSKVRTD